MDKRLEKILDHYGLEIEKRKCCEECAELIQAILKGDPKHIAEEIADVEITTTYIKEAYGISQLVEGCKEQKIERQLARMKEEE